MAYEPVVEELIQLIQENGWKKAFEEAVREAHGAGIPEMDDIKSVDDYLQYISDLLRWVPTEDSQGSEIYNRLCTSASSSTSQH